MLHFLSSAPFPVFSYFATFSLAAIRTGTHAARCRYRTTARVPPRTGSVMPHRCNTSSMPSSPLLLVKAVSPLYFLPPYFCDLGDHAFRTLVFKSHQNTTCQQLPWLLPKRNRRLPLPPSSPTKVCMLISVSLTATNPEMIQAAIVTLKERAGSSYVFCFLQKKTTLTQAPGFKEVRTGYLQHLCPQL